MKTTKAELRRRIARLEAKLGKGEPYKIDEWYGYRFALMSVVAFHAGKLSSEESLATAFARALDMTPYEFNALKGDNHLWPKVWPLFLEKLDTMVAARGGRSITQSGSLSLERPHQDDGRRDGFEVFDELYNEIPDEVKKSRNLLPSLADYIEKAISASQDNPNVAKTSA